MSTPLGQLFDHGCDSIASSLTFFMTATFIGFPKNDFRFLFGAFLTSFSFNFSQQIEKITGVLLTNYNGVGVTEVQFYIMLLGILRVIFGIEFY